MKCYAIDKDEDRNASKAICGFENNAIDECDLKKRGKYYGFPYLYIYFMHFMNKKISIKKLITSKFSISNFTVFKI